MKPYKLKNFEIVLLAVLFLSTSLIWSLPIRQNPMPFGDVDSTEHFTMADQMTQSDKSTYNLPYYHKDRWKNSNGKLWYAPQYHLSAALIQIVGGERIIPFYIFVTIMSSLIVFSSYVLIRRLYGVTTAILSSFLLAFSLRDVMVFLWAQWPQPLAYFYIPVILYCYYRYTSSYLDKNEKIIYFYFFIILLASQSFFHLQGFIHSIVGIGVYSLFLILKEKRFILNIKKCIIPGVIFLILFLSFLQFPLPMISSQGGFYKEKSMQFDRLVHWFKTPDYATGHPDSYFSYIEMNNLWTLPFLFAGIIFLLVRRKRKDVLLLSWLVTLYILFHLDFIGFHARIHRSIAAESHLLYPLIAIGAVYGASLIKMPKPIRNYAKIILVSLFIIFTITVNAKVAHQSLNGAYGGLMRITPAQYEAAVWLGDNLDENVSIINGGTITYAKKKWIWSISRRYQLRTHSFISLDHSNISTATHALVDYSDVVAINNPEAIGQLQLWEQNLSQNGKLLYNKNNIRVYELEN